MKKIIICGVLAFVCLSYQTKSQVVVIDEVTTKMKDRFCLFGGSVCSKVKIKGEVVL
ncbi:hypothetical protein Belba_3599 [Belliella baltica DSM 15883]|uniref:Uncharacterized protein n=1 Tax=Belliella baltica (strain DSM 15883 / CIP 108006 / LMG 21964 / BA134) TaxID=866536 RepID=I3ZA25_BELBD|nr:hypothetical protein [Belliella baltica]AFL86093.1 hypothetical protein Belba_3599 [Belliella baltica DSM 15883]